MARVCVWTATRWKFCRLRWTSSYEEGMAHDSRAGFMDSERHSFCRVRYRNRGYWPLRGPAQARLDESRLLPEHRASRGRAIRSAAGARFRPEPYKHLHLQPREHLRSIRNLLGDSTVRSRLRARVE